MSYTAPTTRNLFFLTACPMIGPLPAIFFACAAAFAAIAASSDVRWLGGSARTGQRRLSRLLVGDRNRGL